MGSLDPYGKTTLRLNVDIIRINVDVTAALMISGDAVGQGVSQCIDGNGAVRNDGNILNVNLDVAGEILCAIYAMGSRPVGRDVDVPSVDVDVAGAKSTISEDPVGLFAGRFDCDIVLGRLPPIRSISILPVPSLRA